MNRLQNDITTGFNAAKQERNRVQEREKWEERREFLRWISEVDYEDNFNEFIKQRHLQTGNWILAHSAFKKWIDGPVSSLLWCFGKRELSNS
jgi:hypothetical protein